MVKINKAAVMNRAWDKYKNQSHKSGRYHMTFAYCLKDAWAVMKAFAANNVNVEQTKTTASKVETSTLEQIETAIFELSMKDRWTDADRTLNTRLNNEHRRLLQIA